MGSVSAKKETQQVREWKDRHLRGGTPTLLSHPFPSLISLSPSVPCEPIVRKKGIKRRVNQFAGGLFEKN